MGNHESKKTRWSLGTISMKELTYVSIIVSFIIGFGTLLYFLGEGNGSAGLREKERDDFETTIKVLRDSIEILKAREVIKINDANIANSTFKKQIEDLMKQGDNLLINYKEQTDMAYKFNTWKSKVIGILNNKDEDIVKKTDSIASKYSPGDYYSQIKDIINLLINHLN
jgi:GTP cyclohydrolase III